MQTYDEWTLRYYTDPSVTEGLGNSDTLSPLGLTAEVVSPAGDHDNLQPGGALADANCLDNNLWPLTMGGTSTDMISQSADNMDVDQILPELMNEPERYTSSDITNLASAGTASTLETSPPEVQSSTRTIPDCRHVASDRAAFLRHLGAIHHVSGPKDETIACRLYDHNTTSVCNTLMKRGNFPRHADTHYHVRYHCHYCPPGKYFSRQDSWKKHLKKHPQAAIIET